MSDFTDAFGDLLDAQEEACGQRLQATVDGVTADCVVGEGLLDQILVGGGVAENGTIEVQMLASAFETTPVKNHPASVAGGPTLAVRNVRQSFGIYRITIGDPTATDA